MNLKPIQYLYLSCSALGCGILFYAIYNDIIVIRSPFKENGIVINGLKAQKKTFKLFYFWQNRLHVEEKELIAESTQKTALYLVQSWLTLLEEEKIMSKKVSVQSIAVDSAGNELYISFDRNPFSKESSIHHKLLWIEGILKTIRENGIQVQTVRFLVHHKPLQDPHLDFSQGWPRMGYLPQ